MGVYKLSRIAETDLAKMYEHGVATFGLPQAKDYLSGMHSLLQILSDNVTLGRDASEFLSSLRRFSYKAHTIFYLVNEDAIFIVRILNQSMDYESNL